MRISKNGNIEEWESRNLQEDDPTAWLRNYQGPTLITDNVARRLHFDGSDCICYKCDPQKEE